MKTLLALVALPFALVLVGASVLLFAAAGYVGGAFVGIFFGPEGPTDGYAIGGAVIGLLLGLGQAMTMRR